MPPGGRGVDLPSAHRGDLGLQVERGAHRHRPDEVGLQPPGHRDRPQQPVQRAERLVQRAWPAPRRAPGPGAPWWAGRTVNSAVTRTPSPARASRCRPCGCRRHSRSTGRSARRGALRVRARRGGAPAPWRRREASAAADVRQSQRADLTRAGRQPAVACQAWLHAALRRTPHRAPSWWLIAVLVGVAAALILLPLGTLPMLGGLVGGTAVAGVMVSSYGSVRIRVVGGLAGRRRREDPGDGARARPRCWTRTRRAPGARTRLIRGPSCCCAAMSPPRCGWRSPIRQDPTPYVYLSTRDPEAAPAPRLARTTGRLARRPPHDVS